MQDGGRAAVFGLLDGLLLGRRLDSLLGGPDGVERLAEVISPRRQLLAFGVGQRVPLIHELRPYHRHRRQNQGDEAVKTAADKYLADLKAKAQIVYG